MLLTMIVSLAEYSRLLNGNTEKDILDSYRVVVDSAFKILSDIRHVKYQDARLNDAAMIFQMTVLKSLSCIEVSKQFKYENPYDSSFVLREMRDPFSLLTVVRNQFETFSNFNHLYTYHKRDDFRELIYNLWVIAGLKYRQVHDVISDENKLKKQKELAEINVLHATIVSSQFYIGLSAKSKKIVDQCIKRKDWKITLSGAEIVKIDWQQLFLNAGCGNFLNTGYNFLSQYTHPSYVSVFQFRELYSENNHEFQTLFGVQISRALCAFLISDYCSFSIAAKISFETLPSINQLLINTYNKVFRDSSYVINHIDSDIQFV